MKSPAPASDGFEKSPFPGGAVYFCGESMNSTLDERDELILEAVDHIPPRVGDVIVFRNPQGAGIIAHRVIGLERDHRLRTRGDNNPLEDEFLVGTAETLGRVTHARRNGRTRPIRGGFAGRVGGWLMRLRRGARRTLIRGLQPLYLRLAASKLAQRVFSVSHARVVRFDRGQRGPELQLLLGRRLIGRLPAGANRWRIRPPYRLFLDEGALPTHESLPHGGPED